MANNGMRVGDWYIAPIADDGELTGDWEVVGVDGSDLARFGSYEAAYACVRERIAAEGGPMSETPTTWHIEPTHPTRPDSEWVVYEDAGEHEKRLTIFTGPDAEARARAYHKSLTAPSWATVVAALELARRQLPARDALPNVQTAVGDAVAAVESALAAAAPLLREGQ